MKKYLMAFFSITMAVALSAFATKHKSKNTTQDPYWYTVVDVNGVLKFDQILFGATRTSKANAETVDCDDSGTPVCYAASDFNNVGGGTTPITQSPALIIKETAPERK